MHICQIKVVPFTLSKTCTAIKRQTMSKQIENKKISRLVHCYFSLLENVKKKQFFKTMSACYYITVLKK